MNMEKKPVLPIISSEENNYFGTATLPNLLVTTTAASTSPLQEFCLLRLSSPS